MGWSGDVEKIEQFARNTRRTVQSKEEREGERMKGEKGMNE